MKETIEKSIKLKAGSLRIFKKKKGKPLADSSRKKGRRLKLVK